MVRSDLEARANARKSNAQTNGTHRHVAHVILWGSKTIIIFPGSYTNLNLNSYIPGSHDATVLRDSSEPTHTLRTAMAVLVKSKGSELKTFPRKISYVIMLVKSILFNSQINGTGWDNISDMLNSATWKI